MTKANAILSMTKYVTSTPTAEPEAAIEFRQQRELVVRMLSDLDRMKLLPLPSKVREYQQAIYFACRQLLKVESILGTAAQDAHFGTDGSCKPKTNAAPGNRKDE